MAVQQRQHMGIVGCQTFLLGCSACLSAIFCLFLAPGLQYTTAYCVALRNKWTMKITEEVEKNLTEKQIGIAKCLRLTPHTVIKKREIQDEIDKFGRLCKKI